MDRTRFFPRARFAKAYGYTDPQTMAERDFPGKAVELHCSQCGNVRPVAENPVVCPECGEVEDMREVKE